MGFFVRDYMKPGKGVSKDEPKKKGLSLFFDIILHKFSKFIGANMLYSLVSVVWLVCLYLLGGIILVNTGMAQRISDVLAQTSGIDADTVYQYAMTSLHFMFVTAVFSLWGSGPASAAYAYINRSFTRGEHAWLLSDGVDKIKENFKKGMIVVLIDAVVLMTGANAIAFYASFYAQTGSVMWLFLMCIVTMVLVVYTMMHPYLYQIMVTFECSVASMYKNAFIIAMAKLPGNFLILLAEVAVIVILFFVVNPVVAMILALVLGLCFTRYPGDFYAARVINSTIIENMKTKQPKVEYIEEDK